ncbi:PDZ and LIM domain protein Zasp [Eumeta japonica]|uniref:PDZ and LIM domain protein Zasp n=1 Tax=Eumeta variegata TaxID=151549 RepID=A0A4C1ZUQ1_EUMVA|nr:PDZ and LIM domain protein Zasp [Eumeta japonica]
MAQLVTVRLDKSDHQPLGFRLQGGKDFGTPLVVQKWICHRDSYPDVMKLNKRILIELVHLRKVLMTM